MVFDVFQKMVQHFEDVGMVVEYLVDLDDLFLLHQLKRKTNTELNIFVYFLLKIKCNK